MSQHRITNQMRREAARVMSQLGLPRIGIISNYDPNTYSAKAYIQPENTESGWLPIESPWIGNGWGMFCPPTTGDVVEIKFQEGSKQGPMIGLRHYGNVFNPLKVPSGEFWLVDKNGNFFKFTDNKVKINGDVEIDVTTPTINITVTTANITATTVNANVTTANVTASSAVNITAPNTNVDGNLTVTGNIVATGDISDLNNASGTLNNIRVVYDGHDHPAPGGTTGAPNQPL